MTAVLAASLRSKAPRRSFARCDTSARGIPRSMPAYMSNCMPVSLSKISSDCGITPMSPFAASRSRHTSTPRIMAMPASGRSRPVSIVSVVVLPAPLGPTNP